MKEQELAGQHFLRLVKIMNALRSENGCPWDREQDEETITNYLLEEVYETVEAISSSDLASVSEELGDVMMELVFLAQIYTEKKKFTITDVLAGINQKMIKRHPHVFGGKKTETSKQVVRDWNKQKTTEKKRESVFDGMVVFAPALITAYQMGQRVSNYGFDWENPLLALKKVKEEISELEKAIENEAANDEVASELGDVLFSIANVSRLSGVNPEVALLATNRKFIQRFKYVEEMLKRLGKSLEESSLEEMNEIWEKAKLEENKEGKL